MKYLSRLKKLSIHYRNRPEIWCVCSHLHTFFFHQLHTSHHIFHISKFHQLLAEGFLILSANFIELLWNLLHQDNILKFGSVLVFMIELVTEHFVAEDAAKIWKAKSVQIFQRKNNFFKFQVWTSIQLSSTRCISCAI